MLRGWERLKWRVKTIADRGPHPPRAGRAARRHPLARARLRVVLLERNGGAKRRLLLDGLRDLLLPQKYFVVADTGWSKWDLKISRGLWSRALVTVCAENHGGEKRLLRVRAAMRLSSLARVLLRCYAALGAGSLILGAPIAALVFFAIGGRQFGRHRLAAGHLRAGDAPHHRDGGAGRSRLVDPAEPIGQPPRTTNRR